MSGRFATACAACIWIATALGGAAEAGEPDPGVTCQFDRVGHELVVAPGIPGGGPGQTPFVSIGREGKEIAVRELEGGKSDKLKCEGGRPTVNNTNRIHVGAPVRVADVLVVIDLRGGPLAPGATRAGGSGIKIHVFNGPKARFRLLGSDGPDEWRLGWREKPEPSFFVNFNPDEGRRDPELKIAPEPEQLALDLGRGQDRIRATGGAATGAPMIADVELAGGLGDDSLIGGRGDDLASGGEGDDILKGGDGDDRLDLSGGAGRDLLDCGPGRDRFGHDDADRVHHC